MKIAEKSITKKGYKFDIAIANNGRITISINKGEAFGCQKLYDNKLYFYTAKELVIDGKKTKLSGLSLTDTDFKYLKNAQDKVLEDIKNKKEAENQKERAAILSGEKALDIQYKEGEYLSGYAAYGISSDILIENNCAKYVNGWGVLVHTQFEDADIDKILAHGKEYKEKIRREKQVAEDKAREATKEKEELISQADSWDIKESFEEDEDGKTKVYIHTLLINGKEYSFSERNIFDFGRVINPNYKISPELTDAGGLVESINGKNYWNVFNKGAWVNIRELSDDEELCYKIISEYGKYANTGIRM